MVDTNVHVPTWRFVLLTLRTLANPLDAFCPDCGRRLVNGIKQLDDGPILYYAKCYHGCGFSIETGADDYHEDFYAHYPESP